MAPPKPNAKATSKSGDKTTTGDRTVKRPNRGYHTFRNGALNVNPKGSELALVLSNQQSPLLRLPGEIRNKIWTYALGGILFRQKSFPLYNENGYNYALGWKFEAADPDRPYALGLLHTCRQIYSETFLIPYALSTFSVINLHHFRPIFRKFKAIHRNAITSIQVETWKAKRIIDEWKRLVHDQDFRFKNLFPGLESIRILDISYAMAYATNDDDVQALLLQVQLANVGVKVTFASS